MANVKAPGIRGEKPIPTWLNSSLWQSPERSSSFASLDERRKSEESARLSNQNGADTSKRGENGASTSSSTQKKEEKTDRDVWDGGRKLVVGRGKSEDSSLHGHPREVHAASSRPQQGSSTGVNVHDTGANSPSAGTPESQRGNTFGASGHSFASEDKRLALERKTARFYSELAQQNIQIAELRRVAMSGIPNEGSLRSLTWKLLLGYLPRKADDWEGELAKKRAEYSEFRRELVFDPTELARRQEKNAGLSRRFDEDMEDGGRTADWSELRGVDISEADHPLSQGASSVWHQYFKDTELKQQIDRDVKRTHPDIPFFSNEDGTAEETQDAMRRILFIFAKLNPGIRYVQGMNEVLAPLFYVFRSDPDKDASANAEADAFFCFSALLGDFRDHFCQQLDNSVVGIRSTIAQLVGLLREHDPELWRHMEFGCKVNPQFYSFRWITLLLTQDFPFTDILRIWDSLLANTEGPLEFLLRICCAMLLCVRERLLAGDFTTNLKLLQKYPKTDIDHLIHVAERLKR